MLNMSRVRPVAHQTDTPVQVVDLVKSFGDTTALHGVSLTVDHGKTMALLGPSGCGKTTLLRILAGLDNADAGEVYINGVLMDGDKTFVAPQDRGVGMVFQDWALFPHLSVARNVGYGLPRKERRGNRVHQALEMVGLQGFADRSPGTLSGGQKQRVALARALAPEPSILLLDEPFSSLDKSLRLEVRNEVAELLHSLNITTIVVTHDQDEAFVLGDAVAVMQNGHIAQMGTPASLYEQPATPWVAGFVGEADTIAGVASGSVAETALGPIPLTTAASGPVDVLLRPEELRVLAAVDGRGDTSVVRIEFYGHDTLYHLRTDSGVDLRARATGAPQHGVGDMVTISHSGSSTTAFAMSTSETPGQAAQ